MGAHELIESGNLLDSILLNGQPEKRSIRCGRFSRGRWGVHEEPAIIKYYFKGIYGMTVHLPFQSAGWSRKAIISLYVSLIAQIIIIVRKKRII